MAHLNTFIIEALHDLLLVLRYDSRLAEVSQRGEPFLHCNTRHSQRLDEGEYQISGNRAAHQSPSVGFT